MPYVEFIRDGHVVRRMPIDQPFFEFEAGADRKRVRLAEGESQLMEGGILVHVCSGTIPPNADHRPTLGSHPHGHNPLHQDALEEGERTKALDVSNLRAMMQDERRQHDRMAVTDTFGAVKSPAHPRPQRSDTVPQPGHHLRPSPMSSQMPHRGREAFADTLDHDKPPPERPQMPLGHDPHRPSVSVDLGTAQTLEPSKPVQPPMQPQNVGRSTHSHIHNTSPPETHDPAGPRLVTPTPTPAQTLDPAQTRQPAPLRRTHTTHAPRPPKGDLTGAPELPGFEVIHKLGQGGMGAVWRAVQLGTNRDVAIKVMTTSRLSEEAQLRFELEIEVTAQLDHPNIGRLYESHIEEDLCYYAMEFIDGMPLEDFAEKAKPDRDTWLRIMLGVCRAVQYAHQKGIIHRDLKPDNVMVTQEREPKVVDFGIAKLVETDRPDQGNSKLTSDGAFLGTPAYMSPEQIQAKPGSIDTRTDVYALGVMLYEQLVGQHPHGDETTDNMLILFMKVVNEEPLNPRRINPDIDREMEALLLKAIARDPAERYDSAGELADDLQRYLDGEPLLAKPQTVVYVLRKKIAKHRGKFALGVLTVAAFAAFALFSYVTVLDERNKAQDARAVAEEARTQAEKRFELGRNFARTLIFDLDDTILNEGLTPARALFVAESKTYLDRLRADAGNRFDVQEEIARAYIKIGNIQRDLAKTDAAISSLETAHDSYKTLAKRARSKKRRARYPELAELATSGALARGRAESLYHLADIRRELSEIDEAQKLFKRASRVIAARLKDEPDDEEALLLQEKIFQTRGKLEKRLGNQDKAADHFLEVQRIRARRVKANPKDDEAIKSLAASYYNLGGLRLDEGKTTEALKQYTRSLELRQRLVELKPGNADYRQRLATGHVGMGRAHQAQGDLAQAASSYRKALDINQQEVDGDPKNERLKISLLWTTYYLSAILLEQDAFADAQLTLSRGLTVAKGLHQADPSNETVQRLLGRMLVGLAAVDLKARKFTEANQHLNEARALTQPAIDQGTNDPYALDLHAQVLIESGQLAQARGDLAKARTLYDKGLDIRRQLVKTSPDDQSYRRLLGLALYDKGSLELARKKTKAAVERFDEAIAIFKELIAIDSKNASARKALALAQKERDRALGKKDP